MQNEKAKWEVQNEKAKWEMQNEKAKWEVQNEKAKWEVQNENGGNRNVQSCLSLATCRTHNRSKNPRNLIGLLQDLSCDLCL